MESTQSFGTENIWKILFRLAPPVMLAQLIQALYNIVDSLFVGRYSGSGLTALSIIYPVQLLIIALAVGTGVGINTVMAAKLGIGKREEADEYAGVGSSLKSSLLTVLRTMVLFVPLGYVFSRFGLNWFWMTYPVTEVITSLVGLYYYRQFLRQDSEKY